MAAFGASSSLPHVPAKACILIAERALSLGGGNASSCPWPDLRRCLPGQRHRWIADLYSVPPPHQLRRGLQPLVCILYYDFRISGLKLTAMVDQDSHEKSGPTPPRAPGARDSVPPAEPLHSTTDTGSLPQAATQGTVSARPYRTYPANPASPFSGATSREPAAGAAFGGISSSQGTRTSPLTSPSFSGRTSPPLGSRGQVYSPFAISRSESRAAGFQADSVKGADLYVRDAKPHSETLRTIPGGRWAILRGATGR